jgi:hypothetical protein
MALKFTKKNKIKIVNPPKKLKTKEKKNIKRF